MRPLTFSFLGLIFGASIYWLAIPAKADQRLDIFLQKYDLVKDMRLPLAHPDSPFAPYLARHFEDGLSILDLETLRKAQEQGECLPIDRLVFKGFLGLYPFLKPAFESRGRKLKFLLISNYRTAFSRCFSYRSLREVLSRHELSEFPTFDMGVGLPLVQGRRWHDRTPDDREIMFSVQFRLGTIAFCDDYPPSLIDVLSMANKPGGMVLSPEEELYLNERANKHGILKISKYRQAINQFNQHFGSNENFRQLRIASKKNKLIHLKTISGFWQNACNSMRDNDQKQLIGSTHSPTHH